MKRLLAVVVGLAMCGLVGYRVSHGVSAAQAAGQFSSQPQMRYAANVAIPIGTPVISTTSGCAQTSECVTPTTTTGFIAGISITANVANGPVYIAQYGSALCSFDSAATLGDSVTVAPGFCHDEPVNTRTNISFLAGYIGRVIAIPNQSICPSTYCAYVNIIAPGTTGLLVTASQMDASMPAYVQSVQNTSAGPQGPQGVAGQNGSAGQAGAVGSTGPQGSTGSQGPIGPIGQTGAQGISGQNGATGQTGQTGTQGIQGITGQAGPTGPAGAASTVPGPTGAQGPTGPASTVAGPQGNPGSNGSAPTVAVGTVTGLAAGANPTITNSGTNSAATFNFGLPAGATGGQGVQGIQGVAGANGSNGTPATVSVGTTTTGPAGSSASVTNSGTASAATFNFTIPQGIAGVNGTNGASGIGPFSAPSASWPSWLVPTVTNPSTTPSLAVAASAIPNTALANPVTYYTTGGAITAPRHWVGNVTSSASTGAWTADISAAGFTTVYSVQAQAKSTGTTAATTYSASTVTVSNTTITGQAFGYTTSVVGLLPLTQATAALTIYVDVVGK